MIAGEHRLALPAGYQLGKYRFKEILGAGGFGITYLADDHSLGRSVAIKELLPNDIATRLDGSTVVAKTKGEEENLVWARDRFMKEGKALAACDHPNVVNVYEMIEANGTAYMVTKYESGRSFSAWLKEVEGAPREKELRAVLQPLLSGLDKVHKAGFLHRDLKPENIYITDDGRPILLDFGSARQAVSDRTTSLTSIVTSGYAPFEQYHEDGKQGAWTDIYALGAVMYRAIHGRKPPEATRRLKDDPCIDLSREYAGKYSAQFLNAIDKALAVEARKRPQSVAEWREMMGVAPTEEDEAAPPWWQQKLQAFVAFARAKPAIVGGAALGVLAVGFLVAKLVPPKPDVVTGGATPAPSPLAIVTPAPGNVTPASATPGPVAVVTPPPQPATPKPATPAVVNVTPTPKLDPPKSLVGPQPGQKWTNSLGSVYAPVPGTAVHMGVTEIRFGDFEAFAKATGYRPPGAAFFDDESSVWKKHSGLNWTRPGYSQTAKHPVVCVNAYDAVEFCRWLTGKERAEGRIDPKLAYRLPTVDEWDAAVGNQRYPWGDNWPPENGTANISGEEASTLTPPPKVLAGYRDDFQGAAPVGAFPANSAGFHDLSGNVSEWTCTWYRKELNPPDVRARVTNLDDDGGGKTFLVFRGGSWNVSSAILLTSLFRSPLRPAVRAQTFGFRCVLGLESEQDALDLPPPPPEAQVAPPTIAPADGELAERRLVGNWSKEAAKRSDPPLHWEIAADGSYTITAGDTTIDTGTLTASKGILALTSQTSGQTLKGTYQLRTASQIYTKGLPNSGTWKKDRTASVEPSHEPEQADDTRGDKPKPKSSGTQTSSRSKEDDRPSRPKSSGTNVERKARDGINTLRRRFGF